MLGHDDGHDRQLFGLIAALIAFPDLGIPRTARELNLAFKCWHDIVLEGYFGTGHEWEE